MLDAVRESGQVTPDELPAVVGRISFFCDAGIRFVDEVCKMRAFTALWDRIAAERYGVTDPALRPFRYGVQVNELFAGSHVIEARTAELAEAATAELDDILTIGGAFDAIEEMKARLVASQSERTRRIEAGELTVVGVNRFEEGDVSPLGGEGAVLRVDPAVGAALVEDVEAWRTVRDPTPLRRAVDDLRRVAESDANVMPATIALAHAGGTVGEWAGTLRDLWGDCRAATGVRGAAAAPGGDLATPRRAVAPPHTAEHGSPPRFLVAKPGLDGHSNGAEQIAVAARDTGFEVIYQGIRQAPAQIAAVARDEDVDLVGLSILSGSHLQLVAETVALLARAGVDAPVIVGGIIPAADEVALRASGVAAVYTPKDFRLEQIMVELAALRTAERIRPPRRKRSAAAGDTHTSRTLNPQIDPQIGGNGDLTRSGAVEAGLLSGSGRPTDGPAG